MENAAPNYLAILIAAAAAFAFGAVWYGTLSKPWMKAANKTPEDANMSPVLFAITFVANLVMAWVLSWVLIHTGSAGIGGGIMTAVMVWLGFMATTVTVNQRYQGFGWDLTIIDSGHWLGVAIVMGAILGWFAA